jgi:hypothetical protein
MLAALSVLQGLATVAIDLNRTHATHPGWPGHARFHVVWQTATTALLAVAAAALVLCSGPFAAERFYLTAMLTAIPMAGFFAALAARGLYKGTLSDVNGMPTLKIRLGSSIYQIDLNLVAEIGGVVALTAIVVLYRSAGVAR